MKHFLYIHDGDSNGVFNYLGTHGKTWINPVTSGNLRLTASSPVCRHTDPKVLPSRQFHANNFAGPRMGADGSLMTYWQADLGQHRKLVCNYYTIRTDSSATLPRNFVLEGSSDGVVWEVLKEHRDEKGVKLPGKYYSW